MTDEVDNPRLKALQELRAYVAQQFRVMGISDNKIEVPQQGYIPDLLTPSGFINAPDTWTSKLADSENDLMKAEVNGVSSACSDLINQIDAEINRIFQENKQKVPEDSPEAKWPN
jgi:hypothetical protein